MKIELTARQAKMLEQLLSRAITGGAPTNTEKTLSAIVYKLQQARAAA